MKLLIKSETLANIENISVLVLTQTVFRGTENKNHPRPDQRFCSLKHHIGIVGFWKKSEM